MTTKFHRRLILYEGTYGVLAVPLTESDFTTIEAAAIALAEKLASIARRSISSNGEAVLALSGGRTPSLVFNHLRQLRLDWSRVTVTLTDERWVPANHPDSNENLVRTQLLKGPAGAAKFVPLFGAEASPDAGLAACEARLSAMNRPIDAVYLGMGSDGHIASLFPGTQAALRSQRTMCVAVPAAAGRHPRLSLSINTILKAGEILLLYAGQDKHDAYLTAKATEDSPDNPLSLILCQQETPVSVLRAQ